MIPKIWTRVKVLVLFALKRRAICFVQPVLQYTSAFDDEVAESPEEGPEQGLQLPGEFLESLPEEEVTEGATADPEPLQIQEEEEEIPSDRGSEGGRPVGPMAHVPYYYFYQGRF